MLQSNNGTGPFLYSKEGITQEDPLSMFEHDIGICHSSDYSRLNFLWWNNLDTQMMPEQAGSLPTSINFLANFRR
jgi:hypothetical protein